MKLISFLTLLFLFSACSKNTSQVELNSNAQRGKKSYNLHCILCHNPNPMLDGTIGPSLKGSSYELIEMRVLTRKYPDGYKPKRSSELMPEFPMLKEEIIYIYEYIKAFEEL